MAITHEHRDNFGPDEPTATNYDDLHTAPPRTPRGLARDRGSCEPLDELERLPGDLPPAGVDRQRVPAPGHLDDLGHALVALLFSVRRVRDRPGNRLVRVGRDDEHWTALGVRRVDLCLRPRVDVRGGGLEERLAGAGGGGAEVQLHRLLLADGLW